MQEYSFIERQPLPHRPRKDPKRVTIIGEGDRNGTLQKSQCTLMSWRESATRKRSERRATVMRIARLNGRQEATLGLKTSLKKKGGEEG